MSVRTNNVLQPGARATGEEPGGPHHRSFELNVIPTILPYREQELI